METMSNECEDRDLLAIEPVLFTAGGFESQHLLSGSDGVISGTAFTSVAGNFVTAGIRPGMVLCVYTASPAEAKAYEIVSVGSAHSLSVSVLRGDEQADPVAPPPGTALKFFVCSFGPQIAAAVEALEAKLRLVSEAAGIAPADYVDSPQFRQAAALGAIAAIFTARAANTGDSDANWVKAEHYRQQHIAAVSAVRLAKDADGDGYAESTRTLGHVSLRRA